jgi:Kef-type K+ transport system membrane component KefB
VTFGVLALVVAAGLGGPLLAVVGRSGFVPVVVGELAAGVVIGDTGFRWLDPNTSGLAFFAAVGFAMLMFGAGLQVPVRQPGISTGLRRGLLAAIVVAALAVPAGIAVAALTPNGHGAVYALLLASGSAAILLPALEEQDLLTDQRALVVMAQVGIADVAAIVALPLVIQPSKALNAALGGLAVIAGVVGLFLIAHTLRRTSIIRRLRHASRTRGWALDLRIALLVLFTLAWIAVRGGTSVLIAGFSVGLLVALVGGPKRLSTQVTGIAAGFFVPLFLVVLGAELDLRALVERPSLIELTVLLLAANVLVHELGALITRQPLGAGLAATAQLGVPAAVATLGLDQHTLSSPQAAAILLAALGTVAICPVGIARLRIERAAGASSDHTTGKAHDQHDDARDDRPHR